MKKYSFFYHYNKPASLKAGRNQLTVHYQNMCLLVDGVDVRVPCKSKNRKKQPRCVLVGKCTSIIIENGIAIIN